MVMRYEPTAPDSHQPKSRLPGPNNAHMLHAHQKRAMGLLHILLLLVKLVVLKTSKPNGLERVKHHWSGCVAIGMKCQSFVLQNISSGTGCAI